VRLSCLALVFAGLYLEQMEVSLNSLILVGLSFKVLPDFKRVNSRSRHKVQPACLKFSISYISQSTPFLTS